MKENLKPCPFCGGEAMAYLEDNGEGFDFNYVKCVDCWVGFEEQNGRITGDEEDYTHSDEESLKSLIEKWNKRV